MKKKIPILEKKIACAQVTKIKSSLSHHHHLLKNLTQFLFSKISLYLKPLAHLPT